MLYLVINVIRIIIYYCCLCFLCSYILSANLFIILDFFVIFVVVVDLFFPHVPLSSIRLSIPSIFYYSDLYLYLSSSLVDLTPDSTCCNMKWYTSFLFCTFHCNKTEDVLLMDGTSSLMSGMLYISQQRHSLDSVFFHIILTAFFFVLTWIIIS